MTSTVDDLGRRAGAMLNALAAISDDEGRLTRLYLSPAHRRAVDLVARWMREAGLDVTVDALGTVRGSLAPGRAGPLANRRLLVGSHIDSVVDAGRYDGPLGVVAGVLAVQELAARGIQLPFGLDVLAFGDEEGVRFPSTLISSSAVAGRLKPEMLASTDAAGISVAEALRDFGCDPAAASAAAYAPGDVIGYLEVHIEQGPVLEKENIPLGVVTSIAGQSRFRVEVGGEAGHAGTVPMGLRRDALAAAAEMILAVEAVGRAGRDDELVATVGRILVEPGAVNVIPARASFTLDVRAATDGPRLAAVEAIRARFREIADRRHATLTVERFHEAATAPCAPALQRALATGVEAVGQPVRRLTSGAGHDGLAMQALTGIGMLFVRCRGGISHNPNEYAEAADMGLAVAALVAAIESIATSTALEGE